MFGKRLTLAAAAVAVAFLLPGCGKKKTPVASVPEQTQQPSPAPQPKVNAPATVPQELVTRVEREWPEIERLGNQFLAKFEEAQQAQNSGDRTKMQAAINEAGKLYRDLGDKWASISYWAQNQADDGKLSESVVEACTNWLRSYEKKMKVWKDKAKPLKELSAVTGD